MMLLPRSAVRGLSLRFERRCLGVDWARGVVVVCGRRAWLWYGWVGGWEAHSSSKMNLFYSFSLGVGVGGWREGASTYSTP